MSLLLAVVSWCPVVLGRRCRLFRRAGSLFWVVVCSTVRRWRLVALVFKLGHLGRDEVRRERLRVHEIPRKLWWHCWRRGRGRCALNGARRVLCFLLLVLVLVLAVFAGALFVVSMCAFRGRLLGLGRRRHLVHELRVHHRHHWERLVERECVRIEHWWVPRRAHFTVDARGHRLDEARSEWDSRGSRGLVPNVMNFFIWVKTDRVVF